jgi:putative two-component system response regulator
MTQKTVLVVDDAPENIDIASSILKEKYKVRAATDGEKALKIIRNPDKRPDLVLLDLMMPVMDGYETLKALRSEDDLLSIPVIICSSEEDMDRVDECLDLGADDYVFKPFNGPMLLARINSLLDKQ